VAIPNVTPALSPAQPYDLTQILHLAIIQEPARRWEKPWRHQRAIALFAQSAEETKLRLQLEGRMKPGEQVLQTIRVGAQ